jgi:crotonobetainyl-CoA:carnitine CoA-transferase CaiB-like acyl-CoA transferase
MTDASHTGGALAGVRVVDLSTDRAEMAGRVLADLGAHVVKVELAEGTPSRTRGPFAPDGRSHYWSVYGRGKQSTVIDDWTDPRLTTLIDAADILIESDDPGVMASLGLGYDALSQRNPGLVYVSVTPFGQHGPRAYEPATELTIEAAGGLTMLTGDGDRPPLPVGFPQAWLHAGVQAAADALIALHERDRSGRGQHVDVSAQACVVWTLMNAAAYPTMVGKNPPGQCENRAAPKQIAPGVPGTTLLPTSDGYVFIGIHIPLIGERLFERLVRWAEDEDAMPADLAAMDWTSWLRTIAGDGGIAAFNAALTAVRAFVATKTKREIYLWGIENGGLVAPVNELADLLDDEHLEARSFWRNVDGYRSAGPFAVLSATPLAVDRPASSIGAHTMPNWTPRSNPSPTPERSGRPGAFHGLKVADFSWAGVGPIMGRALADHGATVVRVESATRLDALRTLPPFKDAKRGVNRSQFGAMYNTSKLGLALDLSSDDGRGVARRLADWADVVLESFTAGTVDRMGIGYQTLQATRGDLVMISTSMRGQTGPERRFAGFGNHGAALSGFVAITSWGDRPPAGPWGAYTDFISPRFGLAAIVAALRHRSVTGVGQHIDLSQTECGIQFLEPLVLAHQDHPGLPLTLPLRAGVQSTGEPGAERYVAVEGDARAECLTPAGVLADAQLAHRGFWVTVDHDEIGPAPVEGMASIFSGSTAGPRWAGPVIGEHTYEVLHELLGYSDDEIDALLPVLK